MDYPTHVTLVEVGPRDGLQNEAAFIPTESKIKLINALASTGLNYIEATSFVSSHKIPQLKDATEVYSSIAKPAGITFPVLVPNERGLDNALKAGVHAISVFSSASDSFNQKNINCDVEASLKRIAPLAKRAASEGVRVRAYLSCCLGCPYEGEVPFAKTRELAEALIDMGAYEVSFGDTIGVGTPKTVNHLIDELDSHLSIEQIALHFHDTYGQAVSNIYAALLRGVKTFDSSVAGLGGCPYAKGATGNVATEEVLYLLHGLGIETGINLEEVARIGQDFCNENHLTNHSKVGSVLTRS